MIDYSEPADNRPNRGFHPAYEDPGLPLMIDGCVQVWPDADFATAHRHGATCYAVTATMPGSDFSQAVEEIMYWHALARQHDNIRIPLTAADIRTAKAEGKAAFLLASQDGEFVGGRLHRLEAMWRLGLRMIIPAYNRDNMNGGGALDGTGQGLTSFGRRFVEECDRLGLVLDASHVNRLTSLQMIDHSSRPIVFSHANPRGLTDNPRNADDEQIRACAARGGVIGTVNWGPLIFRDGMTSRPTVHDFLDHIDYLADLLGSTDNIGIGTDFSLGSYPPHDLDIWGAARYPLDARGRYDEFMPVYQRAPERFAEGFDNYGQLPDLQRLLAERGYSDADISGIFGGNFLRVFEQVWGA